MNMCMSHMYAMVCVWELENTPGVSSVPLFHCVNTRNTTELTKLCSKHLYPLNHFIVLKISLINPNSCFILASPKIFFLLVKPKDLVLSKSRYIKDKTTPQAVRRQHRNISLLLLSLGAPLGFI